MKGWKENQYGSGGSRMIAGWLKLFTTIPIRAKGDPDFSFAVCVGGVKVGRAEDYESAKRLAEQKASEMLTQALAEL